MCSTLCSSNRHAAVASSDVNLVLLPEIPFSLDRVHEIVLDRLKRRGHLLIVVAEGAAQDILQKSAPQFDASGNRLLVDVGTWLRDELASYLKSQKLDFSVKYIDPSYTVRGAPANTVDSILCVQMAQQSVHVAMAGRTD
jgi:6-phosphofructokinase 1